MPLNCIKCNVEFNTAHYVELKVLWDSTSQSLLSRFYFCQPCFDLTNKPDKLQILLEDLYKLPAYAFLRPSVPPPLVDCNPKTGPAPPDTTPTPSNDNTTLEQAQSIIIRMQGQRAKYFEEIEKLKTERDNSVDDYNFVKKKYDELDKEYREVYQKEYKTLEEDFERLKGENMSYAATLERREEKVYELEGDNKILKEREEMLEKNIKTLEEEQKEQCDANGVFCSYKGAWRNRGQKIELQDAELKQMFHNSCRQLKEAEIAEGIIKELKEKLAERTCHGHHTCYWMFDWVRDHEMWLQNKKELETKLVAKHEELNEASRQLVRMAKEPSNSLHPPGWYPCPWQWNPETKYYERPSIPHVYAEYVSARGVFQLKSPNI